MRRLCALILQLWMLYQTADKTLAWSATPWMPSMVRSKWTSPRISISAQSHPSREIIFRPHNISNGEFVFPSFGQTMRNLEQVIEIDQAESLKRAIAHTNAILDLYNETGRGLSDDLVLSTLENVMQRTRAKPFQITEDILVNLESIVLRVGEFGLIPPLYVLESHWEIQLFYTNHLADKASKQVARQVNLIDHWRKWSPTTQNNDSGRLHAPPISYFLSVLEYAWEHRVNMSSNLWELYEDISKDASIPFNQTMYSFVLKILVHSPSGWAIRQRCVCQDMITQSRMKLNQTVWPAPLEIREALRATMPGGRTLDAAWLLEVLQHVEKQTPPNVPSDCQKLFLDSLVNASDEISLTYMEQILVSDEWENTTIDDWKILLSKWARSGQEGCGARSEAILRRIEELNHKRGDEWIAGPDCLQLVVEAYLNEPNRTLTHVLEATRLVKRCTTSYLSSLSSQCASTRIFDALLAGFDDFVHCDTYALNAVDDLFRFFMVQHREGRVNEEPDPFHLGHILRCFNRQTNKQLLYRGAQKSLEYFRLFRTLYRRGVLSTPPDLFNSRQLLGTLARTDEPGFGSIANETLTEALTAESPMHPYALGHMYWCVLKCFCNENRIDEAICVLDRWEQVYESHPHSIRLTGAAYHTLIHTLAVRKVERSSKLAALLIKRVERQRQIGNHHIRLRRTMYKDALECCSPDDSSAREVIHQSFRRMKFSL